MSLILLDMTFISSCHTWVRPESCRMVLTIRIPWSGWLEYKLRIEISSLVSTAAAFSELLQQTEKEPMRWPYRPKFLAYDTDNMMSWPSARNRRTEYASVARSPLANPWYAQSNQARCPLALIASLRPFHCSLVGSTPVGLWAQVWSKETLPLGAALISAS